MRSASSYSLQHPRKDPTAHILCAEASSCSWLTRRVFFFFIVMFVLFFWEGIELKSARRRGIVVRGADGGRKQRSMNRKCLPTVNNVLLWLLLRVVAPSLSLRLTSRNLALTDRLYVTAT